LLELNSFVVAFRSHKIIFVLTIISANDIKWDLPISELIYEPSVRRVYSTMILMFNVEKVV